MLRDSGLVGMRVDGTFRRYRAVRHAARLEPLIASDPVVGRSDCPDRARGVGRELVVRVSGTCRRAGRGVRCFTDQENTAVARCALSLVEGRFACTMEWGTECAAPTTWSPPSLIAMRWDFEDDNVPVP